MEYFEPEVPEPSATDKKLESAEARMWILKWEDKRREKLEYLKSCKLGYHVSYKLTSQAMKTRLKRSRGF